MAQLGENKTQMIVAAVESCLQVHLMALDTHVPEAMGHSRLPSGLKDEASADFLMVQVPKEQKKLTVGHSIDTNSQETSETFHDRSEEGSTLAIPGQVWQNSKPGGKNLLHQHKTSLIAQLIKNLPAIQETPVQFLGWEDPLEKG